MSTTTIPHLPSYPGATAEDERCIQILRKQINTQGVMERTRHNVAENIHKDSILFAASRRRRVIFGVPRHLVSLADV